MTPDLERAPFGQALSLWLHRLPREAGHDWDWELERGFHLEVLAPALFALNLRPRHDPERASLGLLPNASPQGLTRLLIWQKSASDEQWQAFADSLAQGQGWRAGLILSHFDERSTILAGHWRRRPLWQTIGCPVVHLFQNTPPAEDYFTVEKNLFALGRVGRRLRRYATWRSKLPW